MVCSGSTLPLSLPEKSRILQVLMLHCSGDLIRPNAGTDNSVNYSGKGLVWGRRHTCCVSKFWY